MPIKVKELSTGKEIKMLLSDYRSRRAVCYSAGTTGYPVFFKYDFEREAWEKGQADDKRLRDELKRGER